MLCSHTFVSNCSLIFTTYATTVPPTVTPLVMLVKRLLCVLLCYSLWIKNKFNRAWNRSDNLRLTQWLKRIPHMIRSYHRCCCINEPVIFIHCVHLKLGHRFHALLKVCSDRDEMGIWSFILFYIVLLANLILIKDPQLTQISQNLELMKYVYHFNLQLTWGLR